MRRDFFGVQIRAEIGRNWSLAIRIRTWTFNTVWTMPDNMVTQYFISFVAITSAIVGDLGVWVLLHRDT